MGFAVAMIDPPMVMLGMALVYAASGRVSLWLRLQGANNPIAKKPETEDVDRKPAAIASSEITPERVYRGRRELWLLAP